MYSSYTVPNKTYGRIIKVDNEVMQISVLKSNAGYYVGFFSNETGPYDRCSPYFRTYGEAESFMNNAD